MMRWCLVGVLILVAGVSVLADTLHLKDGRALAGELTGVTATALSFRLAGGNLASFPLAEVARVEIDWGANPNPRLKRADWQKAIAKAQRELLSCRRARQGLVLGGLLFVGGGAWLTHQGFETFGGVISALGAVATALGIITPTPACPVQEARVKVLARIGLDHDWFY